MLVFSNGGAKKRSSRKVTKGRIHKPIDVRSRGDIGKFENLLSQGPLTLVLIYADWCGACHNFRQNTWKDIVKMPNKSINVSAVREDMFPDTSLKNTKITHYPSLLLVGNNKKPAEFKTPDGETTNVLPDNSKELLSKIVTTPTEKPESTAAMNEMVNEMINEDVPSPNTTMTNDNGSMKTNNAALVNNNTKMNVNVNQTKNKNNNASMMNNRNTSNNITRQNVENILQNDEQDSSPMMDELNETAEPPSMMNDVEKAFTPVENPNTIKPAAGGGLYRALQTYAKSSMKAFRLRKRKTQKRHKRKKITRRRK